MRQLQNYVLDQVFKKAGHIIYSVCRIHVGCEAGSEDLRG